MPRAQRGISAVLLIGMLVLLASITGYTLHFVGGARGTQTLDLAMSRVERAAQTALEWQRYRLLRNASPAPAALCSTAVAGVSSNLVVPFSTGSITTTVNCRQDASIYTEGAGSLYRYTLTATACAPLVGASCPEVDANKRPEYTQKQIVNTVFCKAGGIWPSDCTW